MKLYRVYSISFIILIWVVTNRVYGQEWPVFTFNKYLGQGILPTDAVNHSFEDSRGFLWFSTHDGLCRYDGKYVKVFKKDYNDKNSISHSQTINIQEDRQGNIWVATWNSLSRNSGGMFKNFIIDYNRPYHTGNNYIAATPENEIYTISLDKNHILKLNRQIDTFEEVKLLMEDPNDFKNLVHRYKYSYINCQQDGTMYLQSPQGIFLFDSKNYNLKRVGPKSDFEQTAFYKDAKGNIWIGEWEGGLSVLNPVTSEKTYIYKNERVSKILEYTDEHGKNWIISTALKNGGIIVVDPITYKSKIIYAHIENDKSGIKGVNFINVLKDGSLYLTTANGVLVHRPSKHHFKTEYIYDRNKPQDLFYSRLIRSGVQLKNGSFIFAVHANEGIRIYDQNHNLKRVIKTIRDQGNIIPLDVRAITEMSDGRILLNGAAGPCILQQSKITKLKNSGNSLIDLTRLRQCIELKNDMYIASTNTGQVGKYDLNKNEVIKIYTFEKGYQRPRMMSRPQDPELAVAGDDSYYVYNYETDEFQIDYSVSNLIKKTINITYDFVYDVKGRLWLVGERGILCINKDKTHKWLTISDGLRQDHYGHITVDQNNNIWAESAIGITRIDIDKDYIQNLGNQEGFPFSNTEPLAPFFISQSNQLICGGQGAICRIDINKLPLNAIQKPTVAFTEFIAKNKVIPISKNQGKHSIKLNGSQFPAYLLFNIIDHTGIGNRQYYYRYNDQRDTSWHVSNEGMIPITDISPGRYEIEVIGKVNANYSTNKETISYEIIPFFYQTWYFRLIGLLSLGGLAMWIVRNRIYTRLKEKQLQVTLDTLKSTQLDALRSQMNPHFIFNSLNSIENYILKNDRMKASDYLGKFSKLIRYILDNSKSELISLQKEIDTLKLYIELEQVRNNHSFDVVFEIDDEVVHDNVQLPPMLMQPHVENAILHGLKYLEDRKGKLIIKLINCSDEYLEYSLEDNGVGRKKSQELKSRNSFNHKSHGLDITKNRIELHNEKYNTQIDLKIFDLNGSGPVRGTKVTITIPL
jgi:streptogramin lyase